VESFRCTMDKGLVERCQPGNLKSEGMGAAKLVRKQGLEVS
jgi:hypothetical protein